jgi:hypothetical protein
MVQKAVDLERIVRALSAREHEIIALGLQLEVWGELKFSFKASY